MSRASKTLIEQNYPGVRRRSLTTLQGMLRNTEAQSFLAYIMGLKNKKSLKETQESIREYFKKMQSIMSLVDEHIVRRLQNHQNQLFQTVKEQIQAMQKQTSEIIADFKNKIMRYNSEEQIWKLQNELDYFKAQALALYNQNRNLKSQIDILKRNIKDNDVELMSDDLLLQKLKRKCLKQQKIKQKLISFLRYKIQNNSLQDITLQKLDLLQKGQFNENEINNFSKINFDIIDKHNKSNKNEKQNINNQFLSIPRVSKYSLSCKKSPELTNRISYAAQTDLPLEIQPSFLKHFSSTSYVQTPFLQNKKHLKGEKNIEANTILRPNVRNKQARYMNTTLNRNKLRFRSGLQSQSSLQF